MATPIRVNVRDGRRDGRVGARVGVVSAVVDRPRVISTRVFCTAGLWCRHRTGAAVLVAGANTARSTDLYRQTRRRGPRGYILRTYMHH